MKLFWPWQLSNIRSRALDPALLTGSRSLWVVLFWGALFKMASLLAWYWPYYPRIEMLAREQGIAAQAQAFGVLWALGLTTLLLLWPIGWWLNVGLKLAGGQLAGNPAPLRIPAGVWLAMAAGYCSMLLLLVVAIGAEAQPWSGSLAAWVHIHFLPVIPWVGTVMAVQYLARLGEVPRGGAYLKYLAFVFAPLFLLLALLTALFACFAIEAHGHAAVTRLQPARQSGASTTNCNDRGPLRLAAHPRYFIGTVVRQATPVEAADAIHQGELVVNGLLDGRYARSPRVIIRPMLRPDREIMAVIPTGMPLPAPGERVRFSTAYAEPGAACGYLPNFVVNAFPG